MHQFIEFAMRHWALVGAFALVLIVIFVEEARSKATGGQRLDVAQATHLINREDAIVVDVRDTNAFSDGHVAGAINLPAAELERKLAKIEKYKTKNLIIIHSASQKVLPIMLQLRKAGFTKLHYMQGGIGSWKSASYPLVKGAK